MRDLDLIHSAEDVHRVLSIAAKLGLIIRHDTPTIDPEPKIVTPKDLHSLTSGSFMLYKEEWVFGEFKFDKITGGYNEGKYFQHPGTNYSPIKAYFSGEQVEGENKRLGSGLLSRRIKWYRSSDHSVHPAPPEVQKVFADIKQHIDIDRWLRGGIHNYMVLEDAWAKLTNCGYLPPFDFIELPVNICGS